MENRKSVIIDLDGTLFDSKKEVSDFNIAMVNKCYDEGNVIIIATARPLRTVLRRLPNNLKVSYLVLCNGAWVVKENDVLVRNEMNCVSVLKLCEALSSIGYRPAIEANDCFYTDGEKDPGFEGHYFPLSDYDQKDACKVLAYRAEGINAAEIESIIPACFSRVITDNGTLLQIAGKECTKDKACEDILTLEGIPWDDTYAFGDDNNDLPVFLRVGFAIAMENSTAELKKYAKWITKSNDENGVGIGLERFVLSKTLALSSEQIS